MNSKLLNFKLIFSITIIFFGFFGLAKSSLAADSENLQVTKITRISHPSYSMDNTFQGRGNPFNVDYSRVLMYELGVTSDATSAVIYHPSFPSSYAHQRSYGRGTLWGCLKTSCVTETSPYHTTVDSTLQSLNLATASGDSSLQAWDNNTITFPSNYALRPVWSPYAGETNIVYALNKTSKKLVKYNVDTGVETNIISYDPGDGTDVSAAAIAGFSRTATIAGDPHKDYIVVWFTYNAYLPVWEIYTDRDNNFASPTRTRMSSIPLNCDIKRVWYPQLGLTHNGHSPDGLYWARYGRINGVVKNDFSGSDCVDSSGPDDVFYAPSYWFDPNRQGTPVENYTYIDHVAWNGSNDWFIGSNVTLPSDSVPTTPAIGDEKMWQVIFNRTLAENNPNTHDVSGVFTSNLLISRKSARYWLNGGTQSVNYHAIATATDSPNGLYLYFQGTGSEDGLTGKYTREDYSLRPDIVGSNWEGRGTYIAELSSSGSDTTPPAAPSGLSVN